MVTQSLPFILARAALRKDAPGGVEGAMRPPAASSVTLRTSDGESTARERATVTESMSNQAHRTTADRLNNASDVTGQIVQGRAVERTATASDATHIN
jgi:hypothetical protein